MMYLVWINKYPCMSYWIIGAVKVLRIAIIINADFEVKEFIGDCAVIIIYPWLLVKVVSISAALWVCSTLHVGIQEAVLIYIPYTRNL